MTDKEILPITRKYQDANAGTITVKTEKRGTRKDLPMLITEREDIKPLFGMDWRREFTLPDQLEKDKLFANFLKKHFMTNLTVEDTEVKIQLKRDTHQ